MPAPLQIGLVIFPKLTQLDLTGPLQVFSSVPGAVVHLIWKRIEPVASDSVLTLTPTITFADCPQLDVICVPGGVGSDDMVNDAEMLDFLRKQADRREIHHLGVHGIAGARRGRPAAGLQRDDALDGDGHARRVRGNPDQDPGLCRPQPHHRRRRHRRDRFCADAGLDHGRPARPRRRSSSGSNTTRRRRSMPVHPIPRRPKCSRSLNERVATSRQRRREAIARAAARLG